MERYHDFQLKDHYFWTGAAPDFITREERQATKAETMKPAPIKNPTYRTTKVREADGSVTYYTGQVRREAIRVDGIMI